MKTYSVWITRTITESALIKVDAESIEDAEEIAYEKRLDLDYQTDDNPPSDYQTNAEEV